MHGRTRFYLMGLVALGALVFLPSAFLAGFTQVDDSFHLTLNHELTEGHWWSFWLKPYFSTYIPVTYTLWTFIYQISQDPLVFHLTNLLVHSLNTGLLFLILLKGFDSKPLHAALATLLFAIHPVQTESVLWVSGLRELLGTFFALLSLWSMQFTSMRKGLFAATIFFALSLLTKPIAVLLPLIFLFLFHKRHQLNPRIAAWNLSLLTAAGGLSLLTLLLQQETYSSTSTMPVHPYRVIIALQSLGFYLQKFFLPLDLSLDYGRSYLSLLDKGPEWGYLLLATLALAAAGWLWKKSDLRFQTGLLWIFIALLPNSGLIPFGFEEISINADRYLYFTMAGVSMLTAGGLARLQSSRALWLAAPLIILLSTLTVRQSRLWTHDPNLMSHTLRINPKSVTAAHNLAVHFAKEKKHTQAVEYFKQALTYNPTHLFSCSGVIVSLTDLERYQEAETYLKQCLGSEKLISQYAGTVQLSSVYGAAGYFLLMGPKNLQLAHQYFCESLRHHGLYALGRRGVKSTESEMSLKNLQFQKCPYTP